MANYKLVLIKLKLITNWLFFMQNYNTSPCLSVKNNNKTKLNQNPKQNTTHKKLQSQTTDDSYEFFYLPLISKI